MAKKTFLWIVVVAAIATEILSVYMYWNAPPEEDVEATIAFLTYTNIVIVAWASLCALCFILALTSFGLKSSPGKVWLCIAIGIIFWVIGDLIYLYLQVVLELPEEELFPVIADYFWSTGYVFVFLGMILQMRLATVKITKLEVGVVVAIVAVSTIISLIWVILPVLDSLILDPSLNAEYWVFSLDYPILDLVLIPLAIILALKYRGGEFSKAWLLIAIGFIVTAIYDLLYTYFEIFSEGYLLYTDIIYLAYYMLLGIGALYLRSSVQSLNK